MQVITATDETARSVSSTSFVTASNTLEVSITPSSASNKVFVLATGGTVQATGGEMIQTIYRDATNLGNGNNGMARNAGVTGASMAMSILDAPNTTSAITYQVYARVTGSSATINWDGAKGSITVFEIGA